MVIKVEYEDGNLPDIVSYKKSKEAFVRLGALSSLYKLKALFITSNFIYVRISKKEFKDVL